MAVVQYQGCMSNMSIESLPTTPTSQKTPLNLEQLGLSASVRDYADLLMWMIEMYYASLSVALCLLTQNASMMKLSAITKFHSRVYFDRVLNSNPGIPLEKYAPILIASLALAIKYHQTREKADKLNLQNLMKQVGITLTSIEVYQYQISILECLEFKLRYTIPEDYLEVFLESFPYYRGVFKQAIPSLIDLALMNPKTCELTSQEIFFGAVILVFKLTAINLTQLQRGLLENLTEGWTKGQKACELIQQQMESTQNEVDME